MRLEFQAKTDRRANVVLKDTNQVVLVLAVQ
jgi:hypothetical protein